MKPKTKLQNRVAELSSRLISITQIQKEWSFRVCLPHKGYANKSSAFCLDCGETFSLELIKRKKAECPHCKSKLTIETTRNRTYEYTNYFAIAEVFGEFQVVRNFELIANYKKGQPVKRFLHEILQYWIQPDGKTTIFGLKHNSNWCMDSWSGYMEIRQETRRWGGDKYDVYPRFYHPKSEFKKEYAKYGIDSNLSGISFLEAIKILPKSPKAETILKAKQYSILGHYGSKTDGSLNRHWNSIKICLRNKYKVKDASMYFDYLDLLSYFGKDLHNSKFVCPRDLKKEHDRFMIKKREILRLEEQERNRLQITKRQENLEKAIIEYVERNKKFFDLEFTKDNITIKLLQSVEEFKEEGDELNHCVYTNEYYTKQNSLVFSAKVEGKRAETIEVQLPDMKIKQSRGLNNDPTKYHDTIVDLVSKNLEKIRKIVIKTRARGKSKSAA